MEDPHTIDSLRSCQMGGLLIFDEIRALVFCCIRNAMTNPKLRDEGTKRSALTIATETNSN
eukprot:4704695-Amphidinium_carterae.1